MLRIDLNCDVGESADAGRLAAEEEIMRSVTSANIACGAHAGDPAVMRRTVQLARAHRVAVGAHPGFPDADGLGRRERHATVTEVESLIAYQVGALAGIAALEGVTLVHVKPHGALYNMAARDRALAEAIARAVAAVDRRLVLFGLAGSRLIEAGQALGLTVAEEVFADRVYQADGTLVPRDRPGAVIQDEREVVVRALRMVREGVVISSDGATVRLRVDTLCLHGDTPNAARLAKRLRQELEGAGIRVAAVSADHG